MFQWILLSITLLYPKTVSYLFPKSVYFSLIRCSRHRIFNFKRAAALLANFTDVFPFFMGGVQVQLTTYFFSSLNARNTQVATHGGLLSKEHSGQDDGKRHEISPVSLFLLIFSLAIEGSQTFSM